MTVDGGVWSELPEPHASSGRDCTYASGLKALEESGFAAFPLGAYTTAEREALEREDDRPDETGANLGNLDQAMLRRYGRKLSTVSDLRKDLSTPGTILVVQGTNANLPRGEYLGFYRGTVAHCQAFIVWPDGLKGYDPMAPMKSRGYPTSPSAVLDWAYGSRYARKTKLPPNQPKLFVQLTGGAFFRYRVISVGGQYLAVSRAGRNSNGATLRCSAVTPTRGAYARPLVRVEHPGSSYDGWWIDPFTSTTELIKR